MQGTDFSHASGCKYVAVTMVSITEPQAAFLTILHSDASCLWSKASETEEFQPIPFPAITKQKPQCILASIALIVAHTRAHLWYSPLKSPACLCSQYVARILHAVVHYSHPKSASHWPGLSNGGRTGGALPPAALVAAATAFVRC